jgi:hypothetical protein
MGSLLEFGEPVQMQTDFLEELVAEWLEYKGYIVKRNERVGRLKTGGHEGELDVVAFNPKTSRLIHVETSSDGDSWPERERRFLKKFSSGEQYIPSLFEGMRTPFEIERKALFALVSNRNHKTVGGGQVVPAVDLVMRILCELKEVSFLKRAVPEKYPILRVLQLVAGHKNKLATELNQKMSEAESPI